MVPLTRPGGRASADGDSPGEELFGAYPALREHLDSLCDGRPWALTGVSALLHDGGALYVEITKPERWRRTGGGALLGGLGAVGGSLEPGETVLECLAREVREEVGVDHAVQGTERALFVYERRAVSSVRPGAPRGSAADAGYPLPALFTVSRNVHRRGALPGAQILAIVTFWARAEGRPRLGDLYGWARVPMASLGALLRPAALPADELAGHPGVELCTREPLPAGLRLRPVWTMRSVQLLLRRGYLGPDAWPDRRT